MVTDKLDVLYPFTANLREFSCVFNGRGNETEVEASVAIVRNAHLMGFL